MDNLTWIPWPHDGRPVPADCLVATKWTDPNHGRGELGFGAAIGRSWKQTTAFALAPDQPPQLGGPLEVGASYIRRDGQVVVIKPRSPTQDKGDVWARGFWYALSGEHTGIPPMCPEEDLIARLYTSNPDAPQAPKAREEGLSGAKTQTREVPAGVEETLAAWLARAEDKCRRVAAMDKGTGATPAKPRNVPTSFGVACNFDTTRGHLFGYWRKS